VRPGTLVFFSELVISCLWNLVSLTSLGCERWKAFRTMVPALFKGLVSMTKMGSGSPECFLLFFYLVLPCQLCSEAFLEPVPRSECPRSSVCGSAFSPSEDGALRAVAGCQACKFTCWQEFAQMLLGVLISSLSPQQRSACKPAQRYLQLWTRGGEVAFVPAQNSPASEVLFWLVLCQPCPKEVLRS
jgi:hypothetical protein